MPELSPLERRIAVGRGDAPADLVLRNARVFDLVTGDMLQGDVAICDGVIAGTCGAYDGAEIRDMAG